VISNTFVLPFLATRLPVLDEGRALLDETLVQRLVLPHLELEDGPVPLLSRVGDLREPHPFTIPVAEPRSVGPHPTDGVLRVHRIRGVALHGTAEEVALPFPWNFVVVFFGVQALPFPCHPDLNATGTNLATAYSKTEVNCCRVHVTIAM